MPWRPPPALGYALRGESLGAAVERLTDFAAAVSMGLIILGARLF